MQLLNSGLGSIFLNRRPRHIFCVKIFSNKCLMFLELLNVNVNSSIKTTFPPNVTRTFPSMNHRGAGLIQFDKMRLKITLLLF